MDGLQLFKQGFDNMENNSGNALHSELLGTFIDHDGLTAHGHASKFLDELKPCGHYLGWDGVVYPQFYIKRIIIS